MASFLERDACIPQQQIHEAIIELHRQDTGRKGTRTLQLLRAGCERDIHGYLDIYKSISGRGHVQKGCIFPKLVTPSGAHYLLTTPPLL